MNNRERGAKLLDAIVEDKQNVAIKIVQQGADFSIVKKGDNAIHMAARKGWLELIKAMSSKGADLNLSNVNGNTAAHYAAKGGYLDTMRYLKDSGVDLNICNTEGQSPLHEAVIHQPMDVIEGLVDLGMNPDKQNEVTGDTPMHTTAIYTRLPALEGLLLKGASSQIRDYKKKKPEDVAKSPWFREIIRMYDALRTAIKTGYIQAKGMKITSKDVSEPLEVDRVGLIIENIDIPKEFPATFYCRREKAENSTVSLKTYNEEHVFSDVFHIQITDVNKDCAGKFLLPLYLKPTDKEQMVLRFINHEDTDRPMNEHTSRGKMHYCRVETTLVPETTCVCVIYIRPRREDTVVNPEGMLITSDIDKDFTLSIPAKSFAGNTVLSLKVFETNDDEGEEFENNEETAIEGNKQGTSEATAESDENKTESAVSKAKRNTDRSIAAGLVTDVFQITLAGEQPTQGLTMQLPMFKSCSDTTDLAIVRADENALYDDTLPEVLPSTPRVEMGNIIFEVSHFSIYVAVPKQISATSEDLLSIKSRISSAKAKRKAATFLAVLKKIEAYNHTLLVDCGLATQKEKRFDKWTKDGYEVQNQDENETLMLAPGETFCINITGNAALEDKKDSERKLTFSQCRSSFQAYNIQLSRHVRQAKDAHAHVSILQKLDNGMKEVSRLKIKLHVPPPPPKWATTDPNTFKPPQADKSPYQSLKAIFGKKDKSKK